MAKISVITPQNVGGVIKRINERIADIGRRAAEGLGVGSELYERYEKALNMMLPAQLRGTTKSGFIKIQNTKASKELLSGDYADVLLKLGNYETRGEFRKRKAELYKKQYGSEPSKKELDEMLKANREYKKQYENGRIRDRYEDLSDEDIQTLKKSYNTYEEINAIMCRLFGEKRKVKRRSRKRAMYEEQRKQNGRINFEQAGFKN